jgi:hypothetical protein
VQNADDNSADASYSAICGIGTHLRATATLPVQATVHNATQLLTKVIQIETYTNTVHALLVQPATHFRADDWIARPTQDLRHDMASTHDS